MKIINKQKKNLKRNLKYLGLRPILLITVRTLFYGVILLSPIQNSKRKVKFQNEIIKYKEL